MPSEEALEGARTWIGVAALLAAVNVVAAVVIAVLLFYHAVVMDLSVAYGLADKIRFGEVVVESANPGGPLDIGHELAWELLGGGPGAVAALGLWVCGVHGLIGIGVLVCCWRARRRLSGVEERASDASDQRHHEQCR